MSRASRGGRRSRFGRYFGLAALLAAQEFPGAYRGNATGMLAALAIPLAMLAVYSFVFSTVIPIRLDTLSSGSSYALFLFSGLVVWNLFGDVIVRGPRLFAASSNYVRRPQFPISILVLAPCIASFYRSLSWLVAYLCAHWFVIGRLDWALAGAPVVLAMTCVLTFGVTLVLAAIGALVRDVGDFIQPAVTLAFFVSPVLYPASRIAEHAEWLLLVNPVAPVLEAMRYLAFAQVLPDTLLLLRIAGTAVGWVVVGMLCYRLVRDSLPDLV